MGKTELKIEVDADLVRDAEAAGLDLENLTEAAIRAALQKKHQAQPTMEDRARKWAEENAEAIKAHRERIDQYGVFGDDLRTW